jgi:hypothetical protein
MLKVTIKVCDSEIDLHLPCNLLVPSMSKVLCNNVYVVCDEKYSKFHVTIIDVWIPTANIP